MFSANRRISKMQFGRMILTENIGLMLALSCALAAELKSIIHIWIFILGCGLSLIYYLIISRITRNSCSDLNNNLGSNCNSDNHEKRIFISDHKSNNANDNTNNTNNRFNTFKKIIRKIFIPIRFSAMAIFGVYVCFRIIHGVLLKEANPIIIIGAIIVLCFYEAGLSYEQRGRMQEILWYFCMALILIILITATVKLDIGEIPAEIKDNLNNTLTATSWLIIAIMFFSSNYYECLMLVKSPNNIYRNETIKNIIFLWAFGLWAYVLSVLFFGEGADVFRLMEKGGIPGGLLGSQQAIMAILAIISLTSYISGMIWYVRNS